jgi:hypothetical protein
MTRVYGAPLSDEAIARCRKEKPMNIETAKTDPAPPPEDEHAHPVEPTRYCLQSEGDLPAWLTLPEIIETHEPSAATLDAIRLLSPGEERYDHELGVVFTRARRVRVLVAFEIDCVDASEPSDQVDAMLDDGECQERIKDAESPMRCTSALVASVEVQS